MAATTEKETNYYTQAMPPVRDTRLQIADTFHGCACEMADCSKSGCLLKKNRTFWQTNACQMSLTLMMCSTVQNSVVIMHGPIGCGTQLHGLSANAAKGKVKRGLPDQKAPVWLSSNLGETDVINGGEKKLQETIEYADKTYRPEIIFVVATCAPNIIGDDVEKIVNIANETCAAQVTALHCPGFRSRVVASAYDSFYHSLIRHINFKPIPYKDYVPDNPADPAAQMGEAVWKYKISRTVNLFNATSIGDQDEGEMTRLLQALGLNVRIYAEYSSADDFRLLPFAALNVSLCNMHDDYMLKFLEQEYNIPYIIEGMPIGPEQTRKWLVAIGKFFGLEKEANLLCDYEEKKLLEAIDPLKPKFKDKRVFLGGGSVRVAAEAMALKKIGIDVIGIRGYNFDSNADPVFEELGEELPEVTLTVSNQAYEFANQLVKYDPDLVITHNGSHAIPARLGYPSIQLFDANGTYFGYGGFYALAKKIIFALENSNLAKNIVGHAKLPYRKEWYEQDPFTYQKD